LSGLAKADMKMIFNLLFIFVRFGLKAFLAFLLAGLSNATP
jgi:hypothetical protein